MPIVAHRQRSDESTRDPWPFALECRLSMTTQTQNQSAHHVVLSLHVPAGDRAILDFGRSGASLPTPRNGRKKARARSPTATALRPLGCRCVFNQELVDDLLYCAGKSSRISFQLSTIKKLEIDLIQRCWQTFLPAKVNPVQ